MRSRTFAAVLLLAFAPLWTGCGWDWSWGWPYPVNDDRALAVAIRSDGNIVAAGDSFTGAFFMWGFALAQYHPDGSLETAFGGNGRVVTYISGDDLASDVAIQGDGKLVAVGYSYDGFENFTLARYTGNGSLDATFGSGGVVKTVMGGGAQAAAIQGDGNIVAAGYAYTGSNYAFAMVRYLADGSLDNSFGANGKLLTSEVSIGATAVALQTDGKIVAAWNTPNGLGYPNFVLARYTSSGSLDSSFGTGGKVSLFSIFHDTLSAVALQADGKIVAAGGSYNGMGGYDLVLRRFNSDGSPDAAFGNSGKVLATLGSPYPVYASVAPNLSGDRIVIAGYSDSDFVLARYNSDGSPDTSFGAGGKLAAHAWDLNVLVYDVAVQSDEKIIAAGRSYGSSDSTGYDFALLRFTANGSLDTGFGYGGRVYTAF